MPSYFQFTKTFSIDIPSEKNLCLQYIVLLLLRTYFYLLFCVLFLQICNLTETKNDCDTDTNTCKCDICDTDAILK